MKSPMGAIELPDKKETWCQIRRTIRLADKVRQEVKDVINRFLEESNKERFPEELPKHANYVNTCGKISIDWNFYWDYTRLSAVTQFGGGFGTFDKDGQKYAGSMLGKLLNKSDVIDATFKNFWPEEDVKENQTAVHDHLIKGKHISWLYHRVLLLDSLIRYKPDSSGIVNRLCNNLFKSKKQNKAEDGLICVVSNNLRKLFKENNTTMLTTDERELLKFTRQYNIVKLAERLRSLLSESNKKLCEKQEGENACRKCDQDLDENFPFQEVERALTRGNDAASAFRVALLLRLLGGRYINGSIISNPRWTLSFREGVRYVLERQSNDHSACWHDVRALCEDDDFWVHPYIPLLCLLDLGPIILLPHLPQLTTACERSLNALYTRLKYMRRKSGVLESFVKERDAFDIVMASLSLSMAVHDRLSDLLSDTVLDELGAETQTMVKKSPDAKKQKVAVESPDLSVDNHYKKKEQSVQKQEEDIFPSALRFGENIQNGVVDLWQQDSEKRPGALLVFGPPGTGKTRIAKKLAEKLNDVRKGELAGKDASQWRFLEITPADFAREGSDKIVACAERIFTLLKDVRRCVVLLDEMEEFLQARTPSADKNSRLITTAFLPLLQDVVSRKESILVVATNFVGNIDPAVTRRGRFSLILPLGPPDKSTRIKIIKNHLENWSRKSPGNRFGEMLMSAGFCLIKEEDSIKKMAKYAMGYTHLEIENFLQELLAELEKVSEQKGSKIDIKDIVRAAWRIRAEQVPTALANRAGCDWHTFANEEKRYARYAPELSKQVAEQDSVGLSTGTEGNSKKKSPTDPNQPEECAKAGNQETVDKYYWSEPNLPEDAFGA